MEGPRDTEPREAFPGGACREDGRAGPLPQGVETQPLVGGTGKLNALLS